MKLKELKCKNYGATLKVEEEVTQVKCEFCHTTFAVEDAYSDGYKYEKGRLKAHSEHMEKNLEQAKGFLAPIAKIFAAHYIVTAIIGIIIFSVVITTIISIIVTANSQINENDINGNNKEVINKMEDAMDKYEIKSFNSTYELYVGTEYGSSVGRLIDKISTNNKKNKNYQVTVKYNETETKDTEELKELKKKFDDWTKYEISFEYNEEGIIYLAVIED